MKFHTKFEKESDKVFHQIIMTDEHYSLLKLGIGHLIKLVLDKTYNSITAFIIDSNNNQFSLEYLYIYNYII